MSRLFIYSKLGQSRSVVLFGHLVFTCMRQDGALVLAFTWSRTRWQVRDGYLYSPPLNKVAGGA